MNILHISRTMGQGGAEKIVYELCKYASSKHNNYIASTGGYYETLLEANSIEHFKIPDISTKNPIVIYKIVSRLSKIIKSKNIDCIHSHHRMAALIAQFLKIRFPKLKLIYTSHNIFFDKHILTNYSLKNTKIIAVGSSVKENLISEFKIPENKITIIYNSIRVPKLNNNNYNSTIYNLAKDGKYIISTIGRLSEQKGIDVFLKAMAIVLKSKPEVIGVVIGDGELLNDLITLTKNLKMEENIIFLGYQQHIFELINQSEFVVLCSRWEGFPLTPIETFSMSRTIIATDIGGNNEIVKDKQNGLLIDPENYESLANYIELLINDEALKMRLEHNAKHDFEALYSFNSFIDKYNHIYDIV